TAGDDETARLWDAATGVPITILAGHTRAVTDARFSPDGMHVVTVSDDGSARLWDARRREPAGVLKLADESRTPTPAQLPVCAGASLGSARLFQPEPSVFSATRAAGAAGGRIVLRDLTDGHVIRAFDAHEQTIRALAFSPDGALLASSGNGDEKLRL